MNIYAEREGRVEPYFSFLSLRHLLTLLFVLFIFFIFLSTVCGGTIPCFTFKDFFIIFTFSAQCRSEKREKGSIPISETIFYFTPFGLLVVIFLMEFLMMLGYERVMLRVIGEGRPHASLR
jgi:hypothetical protein